MNSYQSITPLGQCLERYTRLTDAVYREAHDGQGRRGWRSYRINQLWRRFRRERDSIKLQETIAEQENAP